jgi:hypothetical protein
VEQRGEVVRCGRVAVEGRPVPAGRAFGQVGRLHPVNGGQRRTSRRGRAGRPEREQAVEQAVAGEFPGGGPGARRELRPGRDEHPGAGSVKQPGQVPGRQGAVEWCGDPGELRRQRRGDQLGAVR